MITVQVATLEHVSQLVDLGPCIFANGARVLGAPVDVAAWAQLVPRLLETDSWRVFVALESGRVFGVHILAADPLLFAPAIRIVRTVTLWVDPATRGRGAASRLHAEAEAWARAIGARRMLAGVPHDYAAQAELGDAEATATRAQSFYCGQGYQSAEAYFIKEIL